MIKALTFLSYLCVSLYGLYKLKASEFGLNIDFLTGVFFYCGSFLVWLVVLRWFPLSIIFPLAAGSLIVGTQLIGGFLLDEKISLFGVIAIGLILSGLVILACTEYYRGHA